MSVQKTKNPLSLYWYRHRFKEVASFLFCIENYNYKWTLTIAKLKKYLTIFHFKDFYRFLFIARILKSYVETQCQYNLHEMLNKCQMNVKHHTNCFSWYENFAYLIILWDVWCFYLTVTGSNRESVAVSFKMGRRKHLSLEDKQAIWNLHEYFQDEADRGRPRHKSIFKKIQRALKTSRSSINRVLTEGQTNGGIFISSGPDSKERKKKYDQFTLGVIRRRVHQFYREKQLPTLRKLHASLVKESPDEIGFSKSTLWGLLKHMGFQFKKVHDNRYFYFFSLNLHYNLIKSFDLYHLRITHFI